MSKIAIGVSIPVMISDKSEYQSQKKCKQSCCEKQGKTEIDGDSDAAVTSVCDRSRDKLGAVDKHKRADDPYRDTEQQRSENGCMHQLEHE